MVFKKKIYAITKKSKTKTHTKVHALNKQERREEGALVMKTVMAGKV